MINYDNRHVAHHEIDHIFQDLFPSHGMTARPSQIELSHKMLDAMIHSKIALSDAGTGIGKTYAYLVAGVSFSRALNRENIPFQPILISTSSIALQTAVREEYIPFLSSVLMEDKLIQAPIRAVIRKGKSHYVCDERLMRRLRQVDLERKNPLAAQALLSLRDHLDTDQAPISANMIETGYVSPPCVIAAGMAAGTSAIWKPATLTAICFRSVTTICCWQTPSIVAAVTAPSCRTSAL